MNATSSLKLWPIVRIVKAVGHEYGLQADPVLDPFCKVGTLSQQVAAANLAGLVKQRLPSQLRGHGATVNRLCRNLVLNAGAFADE